MEHIYDMIVIGGGPAGYTAALYAARSGLDTLVLEKLSPGGQMAQTTQIDNYPGFDQGIGGYTLAEQMQAGSQRFGAGTVLAEVYAADLAGKIKGLQTSGGVFLARTVVIATGAVHRLLGLENEARLTGRGVAYCAACEGMFYRDKRVAVVGGGNSAVTDALLLSRLCKEVILIHRRDTLRAEQVYCEQLKKTENVQIRWNTTLSALLGEDTLTGLELRDVCTGQTSQIPVEGLFVCVGRTPATELFRQQLALDGEGYILADESTRTSLAGVFAAGDVRTKPMRQVVTAAADGAVAAHFAQEYLRAAGN